MKEKKEIFDPDIFLSLHLGEGAIFFLSWLERSFTTMMILSKGSHKSVPVFVKSAVKAKERKKVHALIILTRYAERSTIRTTF